MALVAICVVCGDDELVGTVSSGTILQKTEEPAVIRRNE